MPNFLDQHRKENETDTQVIERLVHQGVSLYHANLRHANLTDADLTDAYLTAADLRHANLTAANLTNAITTGAKLPYPINMTSFNGDVSPYENEDGTYTYGVGCYKTTDTAEFVAVCAEKRGAKNAIAILLRTASFMVGTPQYDELMDAVQDLRKLI